MKKNILAIFSAFLFLFPLNPLSGEDAGTKTGLSFTSLRGTWELIYGDNYGYYFRFDRNYKAIVVLYLNDSSVIFKGVYTIEDANTLRINISAMKREERLKDLDFKEGFVAVNSSYFIFKGRITGSAKSKKLELKSDTISIDGSDSEGYFEPLIELQYTGK
mgnify:CR=1 FL=1